MIALDRDPVLLDALRAAAPPGCRACARSAPTRATSTLPDRVRALHRADADDPAARRTGRPSALLRSGARAPCGPAACWRSRSPTPWSPSRSRPGSPEPLPDVGEFEGSCTRAARSRSARTAAVSCSSAAARRSTLTGELGAQTDLDAPGGARRRRARGRGPGGRVHAARRGRRMATTAGLRRLDGGDARWLTGRALRVCALYPDLMNIYADRGNLLLLERRCAWRGHRVRALGAAHLGERARPRSAPTSSTSAAARTATSRCAPAISPRSSATRCTPPRRAAR